MISTLVQFLKSLFKPKHLDLRRICNQCSELELQHDEALSMPPFRHRNLTLYGLTISGGLRPTFKFEIHNEKEWIVTLATVNPTRVIYCTTDSDGKQIDAIPKLYQKAFLALLTLLGAYWPYQSGSIRPNKKEVA